MKTIIFGATGGTGRQLTTQALEEGHDITVFARNPEKIDQTHERLKVFVGDVLDSSAVEQAVLGHDAVFCALGMPNIADSSGLRAKGTRNIVRAMKKTGVKRIICLSSLGTGDSRDLLPFQYKYFMAPLFMKELYKDHLLQENHLKESNLAWTIVRPSILTDGEQTGGYKENFTSKEKIAAKISRSDTAEFMLKQLTNDRYLHKAPCISY